MSSGWRPKHRQLFFQIFEEGPNPKCGGRRVLLVAASMRSRSLYDDRGEYKQTREAKERGFCADESDRSQKEGVTNTNQGTEEAPGAKIGDLIAGLILANRQLVSTKASRDSTIPPVRASFLGS
jgi:hypothetical protein